MVLRYITPLIFLGVLSGCAAMGGYERYGSYNEPRDRISEHRESFLGEGKISMAYAVVYWDVLPQKGEEEEQKENIPEVFYVWLRNNTSGPLAIDPNHLSLWTEQGKTMTLSPLTQGTPAPLEKQTVEPRGIASGYVVYEISESLIESDQPGRLVYQDPEGSRVVRYLQIGDMKKYEGLSLEESLPYYAPVNPRLYWYPYYYPYAYYPFSVDLYFSTYIPHRHYYYFVPSKHPRRQFSVPPQSGTREFKNETEEPSKTKERKRQFSR